MPVLQSGYENILPGLFKGVQTTYPESPFIL